ncbi:MAG: TolC family protein [Candidatus Omnitrophota bacterium]|nr:TolC family protein [Candidatus Omnitrophota bacterium]
MKNDKIILILSAAGLMVLSPGSTVISAQEPAGYTLLDCYRLALKQSETVAVRRELIDEAEGIMKEAFSGILPNVSYSHTETWQDGDQKTESRFVFSQPLFRGFKEFAAIAGGHSRKEQRLLELERAKQILFRDVADAFYLYLSFQQDIDVLESIQMTLTDRIDELKKRESLGRSRQSELASVEARISRLDADIEGVRTKQEVARQLLEFLTGQMIERLIDDQPIDNDLTLSESLQEAVGQRPDVAALKEVWVQSQKQVTIARAGYYPEVVLDANQYTKSETDKDWDVALSVDVPLFQGGETAGQVRQAKSQANQSQLRYEEIQRTALLEINNAYSRFSSSLRRQEALRKALEAIQKNYDLQQEDFRINLVNNLDVLQALEDLQDSKRDYIAVQNQLKQFYWQLKVALGQIP